jgi:hypothetical protein
MNTSESNPSLEQYLSSIDNAKTITNVPFVVPFDPDSKTILYEDPDGSGVVFNFLETLVTNKNHGNAILRDFVVDESMVRSTLNVDIYLESEQSFIDIINLASADHLRKVFLNEDAGSVYGSICKINDDTLMCKWATMSTTGREEDTSFSAYEKYNTTFGSFNCNSPSNNQNEHDIFSSCESVCDIKRSKVSVTLGRSAMCANFSPDIRFVLGAKRFDNSVVFIVTMRTFKGNKNFIITSSSEDVWDFDSFTKVEECQEDHPDIGFFEEDIVIDSDRSIEDSFLGSLSFDVVS